MTDVARTTIGTESVAVVCGHGLLRETARDWTTYTSATPFRVPIPEESDVRPVRQLPIETDPPQHRAYRQLIEHRFSRSAAEGIRPTIARLVDQVISDSCGLGHLDVVGDLALPVVTASIAETMGRPGDADRFASWGLHVFRDPATGTRSANADLDRYLADRTDEAIADPRDDIFGDLARARLDGRALDRDEILGFGYLVLAGGQRHGDRRDRGCGCASDDVSERSPTASHEHGTAPRGDRRTAPLLLTAPDDRTHRHERS